MFLFRKSFIDYTYFAFPTVPTFNLILEETKFGFHYTSFIKNLRHSLKIQLLISANVELVNEKVILDVTSPHPPYISSH